MSKEKQLKIVNVRPKAYWLVKVTYRIIGRVESCVDVTIHAKSSRRKYGGLECSELGTPRFHFQLGLCANTKFRFLDMTRFR